VVASGDLDWVVEGADFLVFSAPHEFMHSITRRMMGKVRSTAGIKGRAGMCSGED
jgi:glycerol-3-phosphate dehydrogenase